MRTPVQIYEEYRIMPGLQLHQLRVASVGKMMCDAIGGGVDTRSVVLTCLFHDMGNIVKSDLSVFPAFLGTHSRDYWESVKSEYVEKYGQRSHEANVAISRELGLPERVSALIDGLSFRHLDKILESGSLEQKIAEYGDMRVGPFGILPLKQRFDDSERRYLDRYPSVEEARATYEKLYSVALEIERELCSSAGIAPESINDESAQPIIEELKHFQVA